MTATVAALKAGSELNCIVAERVMGWRRVLGSFCGTRRWRPDAVHLVRPDHGAKWNIAPKWTENSITYFEGTPDFSADISAAWEVVEKLRAAGFEVTVMVQTKGHRPRCEIARPEWQGSESEEADTAPLAICLTALKAVETGT